VAVVADDRGNIIGKALRFELGVDEMKAVEQSALSGAAEGTKLHVVME
jgi:hypothetical protein